MILALHNVDGDEHGGGVTSFFEPVLSKAVDADEVTRASRSSKLMYSDFGI